MEKGSGSYLIVFNSFRKGFNNFYSLPLSVFFVPSLAALANLIHPSSFHSFSHLCFSLTLISSLTLKECTCNCLLGFLLRRVVAVMVFAGQILRKGLDSFFFHGFDHIYFSLILPSSPTFQGAVCSLVCWFCFKKRGCCSQGCCLNIFGESKGHSLTFAIFIPLLNVEGCLEGFLPLFLSLFGSS